MQYPYTLLPIHRCAKKGGQARLRAESPAYPVRSAIVLSVVHYYSLGSFQLTR